MRVVRRILQVLLVVATLAVGAAALAIVISQTAWFRDWLRGVIVRQADAYLNGKLSIGRLGGNLFFGVELEDLGVSQDGERVIAVRNVGVDYSVAQLVTGNIVIDHIRLDGPTIHVKRERGRWNLADLVKTQAQEKDRSGPGRPVRIGEIGISNGRLVVEDETPVGTSGRSVPDRVDRLDARISFEYEPVHYTVSVAHLSFRSRNPELQLDDLSGKISQRGDDLYVDDLAVRTAGTSLTLDGEVASYLSTPRVAVTASSDTLDIEEVGRFVPALRGIALQPSFQVKARGPLDNMGLEFAVKSSAGDASGTIHADLAGADHRIAGQVHLNALNLEPLVNTEAARSSLTGQTQFDITFPSDPGRRPVEGQYRVQSAQVKIAGYEARDVNASGHVVGNRVTVEEGRALAYGGRATTAGSIETGVKGPDGKPTIGVNLEGAVAGLDLRRLPRSLEAPPLESNLSASYRVSGLASALTGEAQLQRSTLLGATLAPGSRGSFSTAGGAVQYAAEGRVQGLDLSRVGQAFEIAALSTGQFGSSINGPFSARGKGTSVAAMTLDATATLEDSTIAGAHTPKMDVEAHLDGGVATFRAQGAFAAVDPARFTGKPDTKGNVSGRLDLQAGVTELAAGVTPDSVSASGTVTLEPSKVGDLSIDTAQVAGEYAASVGRISQFTLTGTGVNAKASGTLSLDTSTASNLTYHVESTDLRAVGKVVGTPLQGSLTVDGTVCGNRPSLETTGTLRGSNLTVGGFQALTAQSAFDATVPDLSPERASVRANSRLGFIKAGGLDIASMGATTTYTSNQLAFDASAKAAGRNARIVGTLLLHPDHQEVHLTQFAFETQGLHWAIPEGVQPTVQYGGGNVTVKDLRLVSGAQSIAADGRIGERESDLRATLTDVDLSRLDTWLVGEHRFGGALNAGVAVTGPRSDLRVQGDFAIDGGSFREFKYETLGGSLGYAGEKVSLDLRLLQGPGAWVTAKGSVPLALFKPAEGPQGETPGANAPVDVAIESSAIDLGLVQGLTDAITKATGTLEAHVRVAGTAANPQAQGGVAVTNGAFTVPASGVSYKSLKGRLDLTGDRAVINGLSIADEHGNALNFSGDVAVHQRAIGQVNVKVTSRKFELLHNDLGHILVDTNLTMGGELWAPRIDGTIDVNRGDLAIDKIIDFSSSSAYSTTPAPSSPVSAANQPQQPVPPLPPAGGAAGAQATASQAAAPEEGGVFGASSLNVRIRVPDDLVVKGDDIRPASNTPIGLGNLNVTLGGDVHVTKASGDPMRMAGEIRTVRGTYDFQGRRFDIQRDGRVRLGGEVPPDPALDITATRVITGVETKVHIGGTAKKPDLTLTSNPPLDEADILSLIVFNQPANQLGEGQQVSLAQRASALATGFVASKLANTLGKALDLDVLEIQATPESGTGTGASVTLGEQVGQRLFFKITQGVGAENVSQFVVDYQITSFARFETTMSQGGTATRSLMRREERSGVDLIFFFSY